jgi:outer membrane protein
VNRIFKILVPGIVVAAAWATPTFAADLKVGVVSLSSLIQRSPQAKAAEDAIQAEFAPKEKDLQATAAALKAKEAKLQKDAATMSESQRASADKELRDGARDLARKQQEAQDDYNARRNEETSRVQRVLFEEITAYAKAQNFDLVLADGVVYSSPTLDITPAILTALQARKTGAAAKPAAK